MTIVVTDRIPVEQFGKLHQVICATGGRYLQTVVHNDRYVYVHYEIGDVEQHQRMWRQLTTPIKEVRSDGRLQTIWRRIVNAFKRKG